MTILHLAHRDDWERALATGEYRTSTRGATLDDVGFIHASYPDQLPRVADEDGGDGEPCPHIYGPIRPRWVVEVRPAGFDERGAFWY
jgi:uncharacterized protein (DUF952 family)